MDLIIEYENALRRLIIKVLGEDLALYKISYERTEKWNEKRAIELKKNERILENRLIYYSDFYDLETIILKNWELFLPILKNKKRFEVFFVEIENARNNLAHGRKLLSFQEMLITGITSDLKNLITIYHNKNEMKDDFFVEIIQISDNLGNVWESSLNTNNPILRVGDEYELLIEANDPKGRKIEYILYDAITPSFRIQQDSNKFKIVIDKSLISKNKYFGVIARTPESEYINEAISTIILTILPN